MYTYLVNVLSSQVGRFVYNNLEDFVCDTYASHIIRSVLEVCSGVEVRDSVRSSQRSQTSHALFKDAKILLTVPPKLKQLLLDMVIRFTRLPKLPGKLLCIRISASGWQQSQTSVFACIYICKTRCFVKCRCLWGTSNILLGWHMTQVLFLRCLQ